VKLIRSGKTKFVFEISKPEKLLLLEVLKLYPLVPPTHHRLSKSTQMPDHDENQQLLEEALTAQRTENQELVVGMLNKSDRFGQTTNGYQFALSRPELEGLLQALNDVRVGSWIALGSPDLEQEPQLEIDEKTVPHLRAMDLAGSFEMFFLSVVDGRISAG